MEPEAVAERKVYSVSAFNRRLAGYVGRVRDVWVEGEAVSYTHLTLPTNSRV